MHFVLDPIGLGGTSVEASFAARYGCLVTIEKVSFHASISFYVLSYMLIYPALSPVFLQVEKLEIGALVLIRGVARVKLLEFKKVGHLRLICLHFLCNCFIPLLLMC